MLTLHHNYSTTHRSTVGRGDSADSGVTDQITECAIVARCRIAVAVIVEAHFEADTSRYVIEAVF
jgi:hypothetical protein